jgi:hypothetical protein
MKYPIWSVALNRAEAARLASSAKASFELGRCGTRG